MSARPPKAAVEANVLAWLIKSSGYSTNKIAQRVPVKLEKVEKWVAGEEQPSIAQVRKLASLFKRPISDFFLPRPSSEPSMPHDFRRLPDDRLVTYSPALRNEIRSALLRRSMAIDLAQELEEPIPEFQLRGTVQLRHDPEALGSEIRRALNVQIEEQRTWREPRVGYNGWRRKIEALGVLVLQTTTISKSEMLGFSLSYSLLPVIGINRKNKPNGRTFTLLHEFVHLLLGVGGICDLDEKVLRPPREQKTEVFCNHVAGAALVPKEILQVHEIVRSNRDFDHWSEDSVRSLARHFCVSRIVVVRRLNMVGLASDAEYSRWQEMLQALMSRTDAEPKDDSEFKRNVPQEAVSNLGSFARLVISSYESNLINLRDASRMLGVRAEKVANVSDLLR